MKTSSIVVVILGLLLIVGGLFYYGNTFNAVDSGGSMNIATTPGGAWTVKIPMFIGAVMLLFGIIFFYVSRQKTPKQLYDESL
jgi:membrane protein implicated in regulation of membrane protease activity